MLIVTLHFEISLKAFASHPCEYQRQDILFLLLLILINNKVLTAQYQRKISAKRLVKKINIKKICKHALKSTVKKQNK